MTKTASRDARGVAVTGLDGQTRALRDVADIVRHCSQLDERYGFRVAARSLSGHIFFDRGRVIHAEFGEDCGLRAVVEMLRAGPVLIEVATTWPSQPSLHLGRELLLSMAGKDASRVVRKVDLPVEPPPLPDPEAGAELVAPVHSGATRAAGRRAVSGIMPRMAEAMAVAQTPPSTRADAARPSSVPAAPPSAPSPLAPFGAQRPPSELPITRAQKVRSRSVVVARAMKAAAKADAAGFSTTASAAKAVATKASATKAVATKASSATTPGVSASDARATASRQQALTTMVRITPRGDLLAARGKNAEQLAEAAAFIHGLANLIAVDLGRQGRANVHLSGGGTSLLVARSEVNDIAAALGPSGRLASLLNKVGFK